MTTSDTRNEWERGQLLDYARQFTLDRQDQAAVVANAAPLLAWLEAADPAKDNDREVRLDALGHAHHSRGFTHDLDDDPAAFINEATVYYAFLPASPPDDRGMNSALDSARAGMPRR